MMGCLLTANIERMCGDRGCWLFVWRGDDYFCEEEKMVICVKRRWCLFVRRGDDVYLCEEEKMCIFVKRRRCLCMWRGEDVYSQEEEKLAVCLWQSWIRKLAEKRWRCCVEDLWWWKIKYLPWEKAVPRRHMIFPEISVIVPILVFN